jgi:AcrR family transcriptional regulator
MSSPNPQSPQRRPPQRQRGHARVDALLKSAAGVFLDKGYDAATMTDIAASAGASIGSLYQFFPTKPALALALLQRYVEALYAHMETLARRSADWDSDELAGQLIGALVNFRKRHPAFTALVESVSLAPAIQGLNVRRQMRHHLRELLAQRAPGLDHGRLDAAVVAVLQLMKTAVAIQAEAGLRGRTAALGELRHMLRLYLRDLFGA